MNAGSVRVPVVSDEQRTQRFVHPGFVAAVCGGFDDDAAIREAEQGQLGGGRADVDAEGQGLARHGTPQR